MRQSNVELLRIIAMFFIVVYHIGRVETWYLGTENAFYAGGLEHAIFTLYEPLGKLGVLIFVYISGYFLITSKKKVLRKIVTIWFPLYLVAGLTTLATWTIYGFDQSDILTIICPLAVKWWFILAYSAMLLVSPILNRIVQKISSKQHLGLCVVLITWTMIFPSLDLPFEDCYSITMFCAVYLFAGYVRLHPVNVPSAVWIILAIGGYAITYLVMCQSNTNPDSDLYHSVISNHWFFNLVSAMGLCMFMLQCNVKSSPTINYLASLMFYVYLIHASPLFLGWYANDLALVVNPPFSALFWGIIVFVCCTVIAYTLDVLIIRRVSGRIEVFFDNHPKLADIW